MLTDKADEIGPAFVPAFKTGMTLVPIEDEAVLYDQVTGQLHPMNPSAASVCGFIDGRTSLRAAATELAGTFDADPVVVTADVVAMVRQLARGGIVVGADERQTSHGGRR